ncbi:MAG: hypothetical protein ACXAAM_08205 [Candidatus Heimdallarchaeaceae archaeon]|jgi:hypothetical protein
MNQRDIIDFDQISVKFIEDEEAIKFLHNPIYRPVLRILREGIKTAEEIVEELGTKDEYKNISGKTPSLKTIYRHLNDLTSVDLIIQAGVRIIDRKDEDKPPVTQKLFARTAKFFYIADKTKQSLEPKKLEKRATILAKLFALTHKVDKSSVEKLKELITELHSFEVEESKNLFGQFPDELAEIAGDLPLEELQHILEDYIILKLLLRSSSYEKQLKEIFEN